MQYLHNVKLSEWKKFKKHTDIEHLEIHQYSIWHSINKVMDYSHQCKDFNLIHNLWSEHTIVIATEFIFMRRPLRMYSFI